METLIANELLKAYGPIFAISAFLLYYAWKNSRDDKQPEPPKDIWSELAQLRQTLSRTEVTLARIEVRLESLRRDQNQ